MGCFVQIDVFAIDGRSLFMQCAVAAKSAAKSVAAKSVVEPNKKTPKAKNVRPSQRGTRWIFVLRTVDAPPKLMDAQIALFAFIAGSINTAVHDVDEYQYRRWSICLHHYLFPTSTFIISYRYRTDAGPPVMWSWSHRCTRTSRARVVVVRRFSSSYAIM